MTENNHQFQLRVNLKSQRDYNLYHSPPPGGNRAVFALPLETFPIVYFFYAVYGVHSIESLFIPVLYVNYFSEGVVFYNVTAAILVHSGCYHKGQCFVILR